jgi:hypothetical protein
MLNSHIKEIPPPNNQFVEFQLKLGRKEQNRFESNMKMITGVKRRRLVTVNLIHVVQRRS